MKHGAGLHLIEEDIDDELGWLDRADLRLEAQVDEYRAKRAAFTEFLRERGDEAPI